MSRQFSILLVILAILLLNHPSGSSAEQWQALEGTSRFTVAYDEQSVRPTALGMMEIVLRFTPRSEVERKAAAVEYKDKRYRAHRELYEIDCTEQTALLRHLDMYGLSGIILKRIPGEARILKISTGSILDIAAINICPPLDEEPEDEIVELGDTSETELLPDAALTNEKMLQIQTLRNKTLTNNPSFETWKELGDSYFDTDQPELAIKAYEQALVMRPNDADILNDQGAMFQQLGDFQRALINFEKASTIDPGNLESLFNSGYVYAFDLNNIPSALIKWRRFLELESTGEKAEQVKSFIVLYGKFPPQTR